MVRHVSVELLILVCSLIVAAGTRPKRPNCAVYSQMRRSSMGPKMHFLKPVAYHFTHLDFGDEKKEISLNQDETLRFHPNFIPMSSRRSHGKM